VASAVATHKLVTNPSNTPRLPPVLLTRSAGGGLKRPTPTPCSQPHAALYWRVRSRRHRRSPLYGLLLAGVCLVLVEAALHLAGTAPAYEVGRLGEWRFRANLNDQAFQGPRDGHAFRVSSNAEGLRTALPQARAEGRCRLALLGDSTVFGWGVHDGETVADAAQEALPPGAEVLNAGQPGYTSVMAAALFDQVVAAYQPDLTVLFVPMHDTNLVPVSDLESLRGGADAAAAARVLLARHSRIYALLRLALSPAAGDAFVVPVHAPDGTETSAAASQVPRVSDSERTHVLAEMRERAATWRGEVRVGYLPFLQDSERPSPPRPLDAWMTANAGPSAMVDLRASALGQVDLVLADDAGHLSASGNRTAGAALAAAILARPPPCLSAL
jgi:lysophospholipase L1-like esterase